MTDVDWSRVRGEFSLTRRGIDFTMMAIGSPPRQVAEAIDESRLELDRSPQEYAAAHNAAKQDAVFDALTRYFGIPGPLAAHTYSTTVALAQIFSGVRIAAGHEVLTSRNEHFSTVEALRLRERRDGTPFRQVTLFRDSRTVTEDEILANLDAEIRPATRVLALTWVYSCDGVKLPVAKIANFVRAENRRRRRGAARLLLVIDGVHGFGVEDDTFQGLGCDLFAAGCHKWVFGPRGTAILCGTRTAWNEIVSNIPSFSDPSLGPARAFIPGGIRAYELFWAMREAFDFLLTIGKSAIQARVRELVVAAKQALVPVRGVTVVTPMSAHLSSGIICFDIEGLPAAEIVERLHAKYSIRATESGWDANAARTHARVSVSILNSEDDVKALATAVAEIARAA